MNLQRLSTLIFFLLSSVSMLSFSTELGVNQTLRARIKAQLGASCPQVAAPVTRSATRSVTRGLVERSSGVPEKVQKFSELFGQTIQVEFNIPYGFETDPKSFYFLKSDPHEAKSKLNVYGQLGYIWGRGESPTASPTWLQFARNYRTALASQRIDLRDFFVPALVLYKKIGQTQNAQGKTVDVFDYLFIDPITEPFPSDMSSWTVLTKDVQFNIPFNAIIQAMQAGKFPLMDANHDVSHFISFLRFPELTKAIRKQLTKLTDADFTRGFKLRQYWLTEALSVVDPSANHSAFLVSEKRPTKLRPVKEIEKELKSLPEKRLISYALTLARYFESQLRDVSGGNSNPAEKWYYLSESFGMTAFDMINEDISRSNHLYRVRELSDTYFDQGPITLNANPKKMTNETATFNFNTFVASQKILALLLNETSGERLPRLADWKRADALNALRKFIARTEFVLVSPPVSYTEWAESFLSPNMHPESPLAQLLLEVFGNPIISKHYLGEGAKRTE